MSFPEILITEQCGPLGKVVEYARDSGKKCFC